MNRLKGYRVMAGYTQEDVAEKLSISRLSYIHKENGVRSFNRTQQSEILELLKKKLPDLTYEDVFPIE